MEETKVREATVEESGTVETAAMPEEAAEKAHGAGTGRYRFRLTGSLVAKVAAFLLMLVSAAVCAAGAVGCYIAYYGQMYSANYATVLKNGLSGQAYSIAYRMSCIR